MTKQGHEPCASRGDCYHARNGRIGGRNQGRKNVETGQVAVALKKAHAVLAANPEILRRAGRIGGLIGGRIGGRSKSPKKMAQLARLNASPEHKAQLARLNETWGRSPEHKAQFAEASKKGREAWNGSPENKAHLAEARKKAHEVWAGSPEQKAHLAGARKKAHAILDANPEIRREAGRISGPKGVANGHLARIARGVPSTTDGILFRSQTEAMFYCVAKELGGEPVYEPSFIKLPDGTSYLPDFVCGNSVLGLPAGVPIELKPARNAYYNKNMEKAIRAGAVVVYWDEIVEP